jgi:hypothetical protein
MRSEVGLRFLSYPSFRAAIGKTDCGALTSIGQHPRDRQNAANGIAAIEAEPKNLSRITSAAVDEHCSRSVVP